jgi:hypothetical protein
MKLQYIMISLLVLLHSKPEFCDLKKISNISEASEKTMLVPRIQWELCQKIAECIEGHAKADCFPQDYRDLLLENIGAIEWENGCNGSTEQGFVCLESIENHIDRIGRQKDILTLVATGSQKYKTKFFANRTTSFSNKSYSDFCFSGQDQLIKVTESEIKRLHHKFFNVFGIEKSPAIAWCIKRGRLSVCLPTIYVGVTPSEEYVCIYFDKALSTAIRFCKIPEKNK